MSKRIYLSFFTLIFSFLSYGQDFKNIRGTVVDKDSKYPIIGASVVLLNSNPFNGTTTDLNGNFVLPSVPLGRASIKISYIGYKDAYANDILIIAGKETQINIELEEKVSEIKEVVVSGNINRGRAKNEFAAVSSRSFEVEQTNRFSGSRNDPARMASNFAGVSGANDARNDIIIRGNSPMGLLWRLEDIDIPSPNHFASFGSTGGPVSMLNNNTLARSDFMTSAFPAEYGNALAGAFDLKMRSGNKGKHEFLAQIGFNGIEVGAEGPFHKKKSQSSFLVNYRYSTLGLFKLIGANFGTGTAVPEYQDLSFKIDIPTKKAGVFRIWGLGGLSKIELLGSKSEPQNQGGTNLFINENQDLYNKVQTGIVGLSHTYFINPKSYFKISLAASHQQQLADIDTLNVFEKSNKARFNTVKLRQNKYTAHLIYNVKLNPKNTITTGLNTHVFDLLFSDSISFQGGFFPMKYAKGFSALAQYYAMWQHKFSDRLVLNTGLHLQYFSLSNKVTSPEPRVSLKYQIKENQYISIGYGLHNQIQPLPTYYNAEVVSGSTGNPTNLKMDFSRSNHVVAGYDLTFKKDFHIKTEVYFQYLDKIPVESFSSSFSMLNAGAEFATPNNTNLINEGIGLNYGLELTAEKFFSKGYYFLATASIFQSRYRGSDMVWRNTAFNGLYVLNTLGGYEYKFGGRKNKTKRHAIAIDGKVTVAGGRFYTPIDFEQSALLQREIRKENEAFSSQYPIFYRIDLKISYRLSLRKMTHEFSLDAQNITNHKNVFRLVYNQRLNAVATEYQQGLFPLPQYRIYF